MRFRAGARFCGICFRVKAGSFFIRQEISFPIVQKKDAPLRMLTRAKSRVLPVGGKL